MHDHLAALLIGFVLDLLLGDPEWFPHPVRLIGRYIGFCAEKLRKRGGNLRASALVLTGSTVFLTMAVTALFLALASRLGHPVRVAAMGIVCYFCLSMKCLAYEASMVKKELQASLKEGRMRIARIVGRDTADLNEREIISAAVETVAENTTDGVIAPMLFAAIFGPVAMMGFKAASTLDSMVGYRNEKWKDLGWSSARLDDLLNYIPARITGVLISAAAAFLGLDFKSAFRVMMRDHRNHLSPNCAWSEGAAAGALGIRLGGAHRYRGVMVDKPTIGDDRRAPAPADISQTIRLMYGASCLFLLLILLISALA